MPIPPPKPKIIAVYGSARTPETAPLYAETLAVGRALAQAGYHVMTGGYGGVMAAASQGAHEVGGHVIGITVGQRLSAERIANQWVKEEIHYPTLRERLAHLVDFADGYVVMPGGVGTLQELTEAWQMMRIMAVPRRPLLIYGDFWRPIIQRFEGSEFISPYETKMVHTVHSAEETAAYLKDWYGNPHNQEFYSI